MVVLPFANLTGEPGWDYLGKDMGVELTTVMGAFPNMHVVAGSSLGGPDQDIRRAATQAGARYVLAGELDKVNDRLRYNAQLFDGASGNELWSARYDDEGVDPKAPGPDIATRIYDALAGLEGRLRRGGATLVEQGRGQPRRLRLLPARRVALPAPLRRRKTMRRRSPFSRRASRSTQTRRCCR